MLKNKQTEVFRQTDISSNDASQTNLYEQNTNNKQLIII